VATGDTTRPPARTGATPPSRPGAAPGGGVPFLATPPTASDVARAAGVSRQTVANVIRAPHRVRPETRERVRRLIAELRYQPNRAAQSLKLNASRTIGYRIRPLEPGALTSFHDRFLHTLAEAGREAGRHFLIYTAHDAAAETAAAERLHRSGAADAFVIYDIEADDPRPGALLAAGVPFVAFGRTEDGASRYSWVDVDTPAGTGAAVEHLARRGHQRIAFVGWPEGSTIGDRRARGWRTGVEQQGLYAQCAGLDVRCEDAASAAAEQVYLLLGRLGPPTAFVTATDTLAVGVVRACQRWGLEIGRDVAVVGFDDSPAAAALDISSVRQPIEAVGRQIMAALLGTATTGRLLEPQLVIRSSSAAPAPHGR
jgi:DNA-binding LacI/PurR family transcriptional regulator